MSYRLTPRAIEDIDSIADYVSARNPASAVDLIAGFVRRFEMFAIYPYSGPARDDILPGLRHFVLDSYLALYRVEQGDAVILRVLHGRQKMDQAELR